jgi:hypothetical protein
MVARDPVPAISSRVRAARARCGVGRAAIAAGVVVLCALPARAWEDTSGLWTDVRPFVEAARGERLAMLLGRYLSAKRWDEVLDETLYLVAPRGAWSPEHRAWKPARAALATELIRRTTERLQGDTGEMLHDIVRDHAPSEPEKREQGIAFYTSPGGKAWLDRREWVLREKTYGLPFLVETESRDAVVKQSKAAEKTLLELPEAQTNAVFEFTQGELGTHLLNVQNTVIAEPAGNVMRSGLESVVIEQQAELARAVRAAVPGVPPPSTKTYLGTVTMRDDRTLDVVVERYETLRKLGTYPMSFAPDDLHWKDVAAGVPDLKPGQTRPLYVDAQGRLGDRP